MTDSGLEAVSRRLKSYFEFKGASKNDSEDLVHEVFCKLLKAGKNIETARMPYLVSTANCVMIDRWRRGTRDPLEKILIGQEALEEVLHAPLEHSPEYLHHGYRVLKNVSHIISTLTQLQRQVFISYRLDNYSMKEIAEARAVSVSSVEKLLYKASNRVRISLVAEQ